MEKNANETLQRTINRTRALLSFPAYAELFDCVLINALGVRKPIRKEVVHKAIEFLIRKNKEDIDNSNLPEQGKEYQKRDMESWFYLLEEALITKLRNENLLEEI